MRKILTVLVMVVLVLFLAGCNKEETKKETDVAKETQPETKTEDKQTEVSTGTTEDKTETSNEAKDITETTPVADDKEDEKESNTSTTTETTDKNATTEVKAEEKKAGCTDTDNGKDYNTAGSITLKTGYTEEDSCSTNPNTPKKLYEKYCKGDVYLTEGYECEYGCKAGACVADDSESDEEAEASNETAEAPTNTTK